MDDLTAFLAARLDEREAGARELLAASARARASTGLGSTLWDEQDATARMELREVAAMRAILGWHHPEWGDYVDGDGIGRATHECDECEPPGTPDNWPCRTVRALAAIWDGHPGCRPEWKP